MPDCFICYSTKDDVFARAVHRDLSAQGLDVFMAGISILPGELWSRTIRSALAEADWVIFLASRAACASPWVQQELGKAEDGSKKVVPVVWEMPPSELPAWTNRHQALDIRGASAADIQQRILEIARRIKKDKVKGMLIAGGLVAGLFMLFSKTE